MDRGAARLAALDAWRGRARRAQFPAIRPDGPDPACLYAGSGAVPLDACLAAPPAGSKAAGTEGYDTTENPTLAQFVAAAYGDLSAADQAEELEYMQQSGYAVIAHRTWTAADGTAADDALFVLGDARQAQAEALVAYGQDLVVGRPCPGFAVPGAVCAVRPAVDGLSAALVESWHGSVQLQLIFGGATPDYTEAAAWTTAQLARLDAS